MIIGLVGFIGSGKNTVAKNLVSKYNFKQESFAHSLKDACAIVFGWPRHLLEGDTEESRVWRERKDPWWSERLGIPNFTPRYALQNIGTDTMRKHFHSDIWALSLEHRLRSMQDDIVISDVRFPNEIDAVRNNGGYIIFIDNGERPEWFEIAKKAHKGDVKALEMMESTYSSIHESEWAWIGTQFDANVLNTGTLCQLRSETDKVIQSIRGQQ
jgi:hypothetical protein